MASQRDRLNALLGPANTTFNGIDFVEVASADQRTLRVHFHTTVPLVGTVSGAEITGGQAVPTVAVHPIDDATDWATDAAGRPVLTLTVPVEGDFSYYTLGLASPVLDRYFDHAVFSFKANCPSDVDCADLIPPCPSDDGDRPPIDYLAKDFESFRKALSDFSALRYPEWRERAEADFGVMFLEALSAVADDLSYTQDRVAAEATLATATQRRSVVRHARLVDYEPAPARSSCVTLQCNVTTGPVPAGVVVSADGPDGVAVEFETGTGLSDTSTYQVSGLWNGARNGAGGIVPYFWDDSERCLPAGSTEMWVLGHGFSFFEGQALLVDTLGDTPADPPTRQVVRLSPSRPTLTDFAVEETDPLFLDGTGQPTKVTHLRWAAADALTAARDLTRTTLAGNLVPATQGRRFVEAFTIEPAPVAPAPALPVAARRSGPNGGWDAPVPQYLFTLRFGRLAWLDVDAGDREHRPVPEISLSEPPVPPSTQATDWTWRRSLLDADPFELAYTVDSAAYPPIGTNADGTTAFDYDGDGGDTVRFGDGVFGEIPDEGAVFHVAYRVGSGAAGNVAADSITRVDASSPLPGLDVTNPFPAVGGGDEEPDETVRRLAPDAFRARQFRAVRRRDYEAAAETLPWVRSAGTTFRWTGSWLTVFTTADPQASEHIPPDRHALLVRLLNRYRLAGYESYVPSPRFVAVDLEIELCARPDAFRSDVKLTLLATLGTGVLSDGGLGFFHPDRFTFGTPLERSALAAAVQGSFGVAGVLAIRYRRRGLTSTYEDMPETVVVGPDQILQVDNDPNRPGAGSIRLLVKCGK
ncbi:MAG TPA: hypothetical protein VHF27_07935 [Acidimicrobiales bacterium]|nr:hypothetical protein [Acidimicrobiales bacterium]